MREDLAAAVEEIVVLMAAANADLVTAVEEVRIRLGLDATHAPMLEATTLVRLGVLDGSEGRLVG